MCVWGGERKWILYLFTIKRDFSTFIFCCHHLPSLQTFMPTNSPEPFHLHWSLAMAVALNIILKDIKEEKLTLLGRLFTARGGGGGLRCEVVIVVSSTVIVTDRVDAIDVGVSKGGTLSRGFLNRKQQQRGVVMLIKGEVVQNPSLRRKCAPRDSSFV